MIIFDLDGTLWNVVDLTYLGACKIIKKYNLKDISKEIVTKGFTLNFMDNAQNYFPYLEKEKREKYLREINKEVISLIKSEENSFYEGMKEVIKRLSKNYLLGIVTNNDNDYVQTFLKASQLEKYFSLTIGAFSYALSKKEVLKEIVKDKNKPYYYVGDTLNDKLATEEAGIIFIHAKYGLEKAVNSKYYINDIKDLPNLLKQINVK